MDEWKNAVIETSTTDIKFIDIHVNLPEHVYNNFCDVVKAREGKVSRKLNKHAVMAFEEYIENHKNKTGTIRKKN